MSSKESATTHYAMWSVFQTANTLPEDALERKDMVREALRAVTGAAGGSPVGLTVRGWYDLSGMRSDADLMVWWHATTVEAVQGAYQRLRQSELGRCLDPIWSNVGVYRADTGADTDSDTDAEAGGTTQPAFLESGEPGAYLSVSPLGYSQDWYQLQAEERSRLLAEQAQSLAQHAGVRTSTVAAFALGDFEWLRAVEAPELHQLVDASRALRSTAAGHHVREDTPVFAGPRTDLNSWAARQPLSDYDA